jgi:hypothetical protein
MLAGSLNGLFIITVSARVFITGVLLNPLNPIAIEKIIITLDSNTNTVITLFLFQFFIIIGPNKK